MPSAPRPRPTPAPSTRGGELALIARIRSLAATNIKQPKHLCLGIGDDCAVLTPPPGHDLLVTTDFSLEGRHFRRDWHTPASAGHRTLVRGLSDLAAMGATPLAAFLSLALPKALARQTAPLDAPPDGWPSGWLDGFLDGLLAVARQHRLPLAGGDTSESPGPHILADIVLLGSAPAGRALRRSGARPGDILYCTGQLGGATAELAALAASARKSPRQFRNAAFRNAAFRHASADGDHPHLFPQPRLAVGQALLRRRLASACIDLSDGLSTDLAHLCDESSSAAKFRIAAQLDAAALPLHPLARARSPKPDPEQSLHTALHGGEDYELLFTAPPTAKLPRSLAGVPITAIGRILRQHKGQPQVTLIDCNGRRSALEPHGWEHLR